MSTIFGGVRGDSIGGGAGNSSTIYGGDGGDLIVAGDARRLGLRRGG